MTQTTRWFKHLLLIPGIALLLPLLLPHIASAESVFSPFELEYKVGNDTVTAGNASLSLVNNGGTWTYSLRTRPTGVFKLLGKGKVDESSTFTYTGNNEIQVLNYSFRQDGESRRSVDANFNCEKNMLVSIYRGASKIQHIDCETRDRLIVTLDVIRKLKTGLGMAKMSVFGRGSIGTYTFRMNGREKISTKFGTLDTFKVVSEPENNPKQRITTTWFAPELDYFPVRIEQHKQGDLVARMQLTRISLQE